MDRKEFNVTVPVKNDYKQIVRGLYVGDTGAVINMRFAQDGEVFDFDGECTVVPQIRKPNGTWYVSQECINDLDPKSGLVSLYIPDECLTEAGMYLLKVGFYFYGSASQTSGVNFYVESLDNVPDEDVEAQTELPIFNEMMQSLADISSSESERQSAEAQRTFNENERQHRMLELERLYAQLQALYDNFIEAVRESKDVDLTEFMTKGDISALNERINSIYQYWTGANPPENTNVLWIDNSNNLKYYDGNQWQIVHTVPVYGE